MGLAFCTADPFLPGIGTYHWVGVASQKPAGGMASSPLEMRGAWADILLWGPIAGTRMMRIHDTGDAGFHHTGPRRKGSVSFGVAAHNTQKPDRLVSSRCHDCAHVILRETEAQTG